MAFINTFLNTFPLFTDAHTIMDFLINSWKQCSKPQLTQTRSAYTFVNCTYDNILCNLECVKFSSLASMEQSHLVTLSLPRYAGKSEKKASVTGILFVLKHWTSKHYCVSVCFVYCIPFSFLLTQTIHIYISVTIYLGLPLKAFWHNAKMLSFALYTL